MRIVIALLPLLGLMITSQARADESARPEGAVLLFDGKDLSHWVYKKDGSPAQWKLLDDGAMEVHSGDIITKDKYKDFKLHVEFWVPNLPEKVKGQGRGNSGIYLQDRYEIQVLDSFGIAKPGKGDCGAVYDQKPPDVNACKPPEQWQTYDITFRAARYDGSGKKTENARVTVVQNGQTIQKDVEIIGPTGQGEPESPEAGPIHLQDHHNPVRYRNIWIVPMTAEDAK